MNRIRMMLILMMVVIGSASGAAMPAHAQDPGLLARVLAAINGHRVANALPPYALNPLLTLSAQKHSQYQASIGTFTHDEPDGSRALQRAQAVGYPAIRANENVYMGNDTPENVVNWWYTADAAHRNNILHPVLREVGIGIASDAQGQIYWTLDISAQPNVLPIFINDDAYSTPDPNVILTLTNENVFTGGPGQIGYAGQVMISNSPDFSGASPGAWAQYIHWTLDASAGAGEKTVYVRFIDSAGRTAESQDSIQYVGGPANSAPAAPPAALPTIAPTRPLPTHAPVILQPKPTAIPPTLEPSPSPTRVVAEAPAVTAQPTVDYSTFSQAYRAAKGADARQPADSGSPQVLGIAVTRLRDILIGTLALGMGLIALGALAAVVSWRKARSRTPPPSTQREETTDGDD